MKHRSLACSSAIIVAFATTHDETTILADKTIQTFRRNVLLVNKHDHHDISYKPPTEIFDLGFAFLRAGFLRQNAMGTRFRIECSGGPRGGARPYFKINLRLGLKGGKNTYFATGPPFISGSG